ncbi:MAG: hypothetical protein LBR13_07020 [Dysgonamonadaceae bacterium]|jgi:hypothetical protein|nr:hypothetical protein [Dysgonamonadaceae bacterium]
MVTIYFPSENRSRLDFILRHIFKNTLGIDFTITDDREAFLSDKGACINYSAQNLKHGLWIFPDGLLSETGLNKRDSLSVSEWKNLFCFFAQKQGDIPFDLFSAAFYLLTSYEEYFSENLDEHGRFSHSASLAFKYGFLEIPLIDRWSYLLKDELKIRHPELLCNMRNYQFISTFDIDHPYLYKNKGVKSIGLFAKDLLRLDFKTAYHRLTTCLFSAPDPYFEAIERIEEIHKKIILPYYLFILMGKRGKKGRSSNFPDSFWKTLQWKNRAEIGLHPSYDAFGDINLLIREKEELERYLSWKSGYIANNDRITCIRRHFLRYVCPDSFRQSIAAELDEEFSLGYAKLPGFRSSTAIPYLFYDLQKDVVTNLLIRPTIIMDTTLITHLNLTPNAALEKIKQLADECKISHGDFVMLWHNSHLAYDEKKNPWINVFIQAFNYAISGEIDNFA